jgi:hypothetical protein
VVGVLVADVILRNLWPVRHVNALLTSLANNFAICAQAWNAFRSGGMELEPQYAGLVSEFNRGLVNTGRLALSVEFEGGEGSPRYGYTARMFVHVIALFEQMRLLSVERIAGRGGRLTIPRADRISKHLAVLARRLGHAVSFDFLPHPAIPEGLAAADSILDRRALEVEQILDSMDRLTSLPYNPITERSHEPASRDANLPPLPAAPPHFENGVVPEAPASPRGFLVFGLVTFIATSVALSKALSGGTPFLLVGGIYFPAWFSACVVGAALALVTLIALRSHPLTRAAGIGLVFLNLSVIYAFLAWHFLFT